MIIGLAIFYGLWIIPQAYNTWFAEDDKLWKNFNLFIYRGTNLSRKKRKQSFYGAFGLLVFCLIFEGLKSFLL